jgi:ubiquinone/menaquinone biosynthesis C-methylase UbiE
MTDGHSDKRREKGWFVGAEKAYAEHRPPYPETIIQNIVSEFGLNGSQKVLDIGCGTGLLAFSLSRHSLSVLAVDRDEGMVSMGKASSAKKHIANVSFSAMSGEEVTPHLGQFHLAVFGTSFHWMHKNQLAKQLFQMLEPSGGIAILTAFYMWHSKEPWKQVIRELLQKYSDKALDKTALNVLASDEEDTHVLESAGFTQIKLREYEIPYDYSPESLLGFLKTTSYASEWALGKNAGAFYEELKLRLAKEFGSEKYTEVIGYKLLTAHS